MDSADVYLAKPTQDEIERHWRRRLKRMVGTQNPDGSFAFESGNGFMAMPEGLGRVISGDPAQEINARLRDRYMTKERAGSAEMAWAESDDVAIEISPTRWFVVQ